MGRFHMRPGTRVRPQYALLIGLLVLVSVAAGFWLRSTTPATLAPPSRVESSAPIAEPIQPVLTPPGLDPRKVELGRRLFHDPRLSRDDSVSCASCHDLARGGADGRARALGIDGRIGPVNTPTVFNSALGFKQFWDGRAETLEEQVDGPLHNPAEMGTTWPEVVAKLERDPSYSTAFGELYAAGLRPDSVRDAIATFERSLTTPDSRFDRFLRGDVTAITEDEKAGYLLFKSLGCVACHQGAGVGGNMFQKFGVMGDYFADRGQESASDLGRFNVTGRQEDRHRFKVPSLRNVARTGPYFHDGSARTLEDAVAVMAKYQLGRTLSASDLDHLVKFLGTLTGKHDGKPL